jgi:hypothetical protein
MFVAGGSVEEEPWTLPILKESICGREIESQYFWGGVMLLGL